MSVHAPYPDLKSQEAIEAFETDTWRDHCSIQSTYELIELSAKEFGDEPAIKFLLQGEPDESAFTQSYNQLLGKITQTANLFHSLGVTKNDVVSFTLPNLPETHHVIWGGEAAGIVNPINPFLEPDTIVKLLHAANSKILVTCAPLPGLDLLTPLVKLADSLPNLEAILVVDCAPYAGLGTTPIPGATPGGLPITHFQAARDEQPAKGLVSGREIHGNDIASLFHTGGTTGVPKLAPHTHENEVFTAWVLPKVLDVHAGEVGLVGLPLFHCNAVIGSGLACFEAGACVLLVSPLGYRGPGVIANLWQLIERHRVTGMSGVPTIYAALLGVPKNDADTSSLKMVGVGAAPISPDMFKRFEDYSGLKLLEGYGLTESTVTASFNPNYGERKIGSVGLRLPFTEMACAVVENGAISRFCETGEIGNIVIRGPHVFPGYYKHSSSGLLDGGWLDSGDLGRQDDDGYFWLTGRAKDLIIRGGHNIDPSMIENLLASRDDVVMAAAVGQPDSYAGELPCAYVQLSPGSSTSPEELKDWAKHNIAERAAAPVHVEVLETLPVTAVGKVFKPDLRKLAICRVLAGALQDNGIDADITVKDDKTSGALAIVRAQPSSKIEEVLGAFAVAYEVIE